MVNNQLINDPHLHGSVMKLGSSMPKVALQVAEIYLFMVDRTIVFMFFFDSQQI